MGLGVGKKSGGGGGGNVLPRLFLIVRFLTLKKKKQMKFQIFPLHAELSVNFARFSL